MTFRKTILGLSLAIAATSTAIAQPSPRMTLNDDRAQMQWALGQPNGVDIDIIDAWRMIDELPADHQFADEVKVALIGFGVDTDSDHPDFQSIGPNGQIITGIPGQDFVDNDSNPKDELAWHEAMAMGVIAAGHNNKWTAGMVNGVDEGSRVKVLPIRIRSVDDEVLRMLAEAMPYDEDLVLKFTSNGNKEEVHLNPAHFNCLNTNDLPSTNVESSLYLLENGYGYAVPAWNSTDLNLRDVVATTCMATLSINYARSINEATSENEKLLRLAALAWIINKVDLSQFNDADVNHAATTINNQLAKNGFLDTAVIEQSPADLFNAFFQLGNAVWYIYDSYWKQKYPTSLINEANVAQVHADAIRFAVDQGAKVINLAQGIDLNLIADADRMQVLDSAILYAKQNDAIIVTAAGNDCLPEVNDYPAALSGTTNFENVISVGSINATGRLAVDDSNFSHISGNDYDFNATGCQNKNLGNHSNWGSKVDIAAPGSVIRSSNGVVTMGVASLGYIMTKSETNFAVPHVSGALALAMLVNPNQSFDYYKNAVINGVTKTEQLNDWIVDTGSEVTKLVKAGGYLSVSGMLGEMGYTLGGANPSDYPRAGIVTLNSNGYAKETSWLPVTQNINYIDDARTINMEAKHFEYNAEIDQLVWNFGDGSQPKTINRDANGYLDTSISHTYDRIGNYNVNLTAITEDGLVDLSEPQKVNLNRPVGKPFLHWQAFKLQGFYFCHSPSMPVIDTFEGIIHENPGCSSKYWYLGGSDEGIRTSGNEIYSCGTIDDPKYGALDYGIEYVKDTWGHYRTRMRISDQEGTILRNRDIREFKCGTNQYSDRHRIYTIRDVMNFWNHRGELEPPLAP